MCKRVHINQFQHYLTENLFFSKEINEWWGLLSFWFFLKWNLPIFKAKIWLDSLLEDAKLLIISRVHSPLYILELRRMRDKMILELCHCVNSLWICRACDYKSNQKGHVFAHVESQHINDGRTYHCPYCNKSQKARQHIRWHVAHRHKDKPCSVNDFFY